MWSAINSLTNNSPAVVFLLLVPTLITSVVSIVINQRDIGRRDKRARDQIEKNLDVQGLLQEQALKLEILHNLFTTQLDSSIGALKDAWESFFVGYSATRKLYRSIQEDEQTDITIPKITSFIDKWRDLVNVAATQVALARVKVRSHQPLIHDGEIPEVMMKCLHDCAELIRTFDKVLAILEKEKIARPETIIFLDIEKFAKQITEDKKYICDSTKASHCNFFVSSQSYRIPN